ncbi:MAG: helix-turn-helix transcriptional regulator [Gemmatimonadota bacterium]
MSRDRDLHRFGQRLRQLRAQAALSQEALAQRAGIHRTYLSGIERGTRNPSLHNLFRIARALGTTLSDLTREL